MNPGPGDSGLLNWTVCNVAGLLFPSGVRGGSQGHSSPYLCYLHQKAGKLNLSLPLWKAVDPHIWKILLLFIAMMLLKHPLVDGVYTTRGVSGNLLNICLFLTHKKMLPQIFLLQNCAWPVTLSTCFLFLGEFLLVLSLFVMHPTTPSYLSAHCQGH